MNEPQGNVESPIPFPLPPEENKNHDRGTIRKIEEYVDGNGRKVIAFVPVYGKNPEPNILKGVANIVIRHPSGNPKLNRQVSLEFPFPHTVQTPRRAFEQYDEVAKRYVEQWSKEQEDNARIIGARTMPPLVGADGRPVNLGVKPS